MDAITDSGQAIGDLTAVADRLFLVIERDSGEGATARFKKIFVVDLDQVDAEGFLVNEFIVIRLDEPIVPYRER